MTPGQLTAILLAGGCGSRLKSLQPDVPKPMIRVAGRPFIEWVIAYWARAGITDFVIALGHLAAVAEAHFQARRMDGVRIKTVCEDRPLGTGGAARFAAQQAQQADAFLITNADSLVVADRADLERLWPVFAPAEVDGVLLGVQVEDTSRYGALHVNGQGRLLGFHEKQAGRGLINAGVYVVKRRLLAAFPDQLDQRPLSLETEVFPRLLSNGARLMVLPCRAPFLDIGTPHSLQSAEGFIRRYLVTRALGELREA